MHYGEKQNPRGQPVVLRGRIPRFRSAGPSVQKWRLALPQWPPLARRRTSSWKSAPDLFKSDRAALFPPRKSKKQGFSMPFRRASLALPASPCSISSAFAPSPPVYGSRRTGAPTSSRSTRCWKTVAASSRAPRVKARISRICTPTSSRDAEPEGPEGSGSVQAASGTS